MLTFTFIARPREATALHRDVGAARALVRVDTRSDLSLVFHSWPVNEDVIG